MQNPRPDLHSVCFCKSQCPQVVTISSWRGEAHGLPLPGPLGSLAPLPGSHIQPSGILTMSVATSDKRARDKHMVAWGSCLLRVTKEPSKQDQHMERRHEIILYSGLRTVRALSIAFHLLGGYRCLLAPAVKRLNRLSLSDKT